MSLVVICASEGSVYAKTMNKETVEAKLRMQEFGDDVEFISANELDRGVSLTACDNALVIIEGTVLIPKPKKVVEEWEL